MEILDLKKQGLSISHIAMKTGRDRKTVRPVLSRNGAPLPHRRGGGVPKDVKLEPFTQHSFLHEPPFAWVNSAPSLGRCWGPQYLNTLQAASAEPTNMPAVRRQSVGASAKARVTLLAYGDVTITAPGSTAL